MKKNTYSIKTRQGVTLIELSVVIAVILTLLSVLFVGASFYKDSADKAACVINQNAIKKAADAYMNMTSSSSVTYASLTGASGPLATAPTCPDGGTYGATANFVTAGGVCTTSTCSEATHNQ